MNRHIYSFMAGIIVTAIGFYMFSGELSPAHDGLHGTQQEKESYFEENLECAKLKSQVEKELDTIEADYWDEILQEIFYSPDLGTCVYVSEVDDSFWH